MGVVGSLIVGFVVLSASPAVAAPSPVQPQIIFSPCIPATYGPPATQLNYVVAGGGAALCNPGGTAKQPDSAKKNYAKELEVQIFRVDGSKNTQLGEKSVAIDKVKDYSLTVTAGCVKGSKAVYFVRATVYYQYDVDPELGGSSSVNNSQKVTQICYGQGGCTAYTSSSAVAFQTTDARENNTVAPDC